MSGDESPQPVRPLSWEVRTARTGQLEAAYPHDDKAGAERYAALLLAEMGVRCIVVREERPRLTPWAEMVRRIGPL